MFGLLDQLKRVKSPIKIGIVGIGSIGRGMVLQSALTPGEQLRSQSSLIITIR